MNDIVDTKMFDDFEVWMIGFHPNIKCFLSPNLIQCLDGRRAFSKKLEKLLQKSTGFFVTFESNCFIDMPLPTFCKYYNKYNNLVEVDEDLCIYSNEYQKYLEDPAYEKMVLDGFHTEKIERVDVLYDYWISFTSIRAFYDKHLKPYTDLNEYNCVVSQMAGPILKFWHTFTTDYPYALAKAVYFGKERIGYQFFDLGENKEELNLVNAIYLHRPDTEAMNFANFIMIEAVKTACDLGYDTLNFGYYSGI